MGWNDSNGVLLSRHRKTAGLSFWPGIEQLQRSHPVLGLNDSRGVILSWDITNPGESFRPRIEQHQGSLICCPWLELLQRSPSVLG